MDAVQTDAPRFLCDEMLQRLGRWLRAAGYDTLIAGNSESDYRLLREAIDTGRLLVTRDRGLLEHRRAKGTVIYLESELIEDCAAELSRKLHIEWLYRPFSRCLNCNSLLINATPSQIAALPLKEKQFIDAALYCPECRQVFWEGSHVHRMRRQLEDWSRSYPAVAVAEQHA